ncbi:5-methylcytosine-specific restriction protein A [Rhizobium sp. SG_E_25_P2]|uniref:HNH endonuclease n=1 Tax=Rhizobium sp. SG_E_25_P2 TaxID=2879942 RepID=UPI00247DFF36|nr:5-methylcytosine-specific restriction protein A [Rhizobium sp. SG_E_25_P2]
MRPPRLCQCGNIVPAGIRCACQQKQDRERKARHDARRPSARQRGYTSEWDKARREYLAAHPHCRLCAAMGRITPANVVDHIKPHRGDMRLFWTRANWQPLCTPCHSSVKQKQERSR